MAAVVGRRDCRVLLAEAWVRELQPDPRRAPTRNGPRCLSPAHLAERADGRRTTKAGPMLAHGIPAETGSLPVFPPNSGCTGLL